MKYGNNLQPLSMLIVEDDEIDYIHLSRLLRKLENFQIEIDRAVSFEEACSHISSKTYEIVFVDYMLADKTGMEVLSALKDLYSISIPIFLSGIADKTIEQKAIEAGAYLCLNKNKLSSNELSSLICQTINSMRSQTHWLWSSVQL